MTDDVKIAADDAKTPPAAKVNKEDEVFSSEYVKILRGENKDYRTKLTDSEAKIKAKEEEYNNKIKEYEERISAKEKAANARVIKAELKAQALSLGIIDVDALKMLDADSVEVNKDGDVVGAEELLKSLKESKPYLFKEVKSSSNAGEKPPAKTKEKKSSSAMDLSPEEYNKARQDKAWRRSTN